MYCSLCLLSAAFRRRLTSASVQYLVKAAAFLGLPPYCIASPACSSLMFFSLWSLQSLCGSVVLWRPLFANQSVKLRSLILSAV